jgi:hypothetical protein
MIRSVFKGDDHVNPKKILERKYLFYAILATKFRSLRLDNPTEEADTLYNRATNELYAKGMDKMSNVLLRQEMQDALHPQVLEMFTAFERVDAQLSIPIDTSSDTGETENDQFHNVDWDLYKPILVNDYMETCATIEGSSAGSLEKSTSIAFMKRKKSALQTLLDFHGWPSGSSTSGTHNGNDGFDDFGLNVSNISEGTLRLIRQYQTMNMCRSALLRHDYGFSVLSLKSLVPGGGRGTFIDGNAKAGSLVAFQPGDIWPKEHLLTNAPDVMEHFAGEDDCQISLRFDDFVVDSRQSPVTVLTREGSMNPWALGHMINHPPRETLPNCQSTMLNFTERMQLEDQARYIPNSYARVPSWQGRFFDLELLVMHGLCLVTRRDVSNEELVYDYRLQSDKTPDWYSVVKYGGELDDEQVVFFRDDWRKK